MDEVLIRAEQGQLVADTELREQGVDRSDLERLPKASDAAYGLGGFRSPSCFASPGSTMAVASTDR